MKEEKTPPRTWFADAGILICRPATKPHALGAALKGGHNAEHHNHNDVGSYTIALDGATPLLDPGAEIYTQRTFSKRRYESNVLNSFGHPVPRVAGQLQAPGRQAQAGVRKTEFSDRADTLVLDLRSAYPVKELEKLERTFVFSREGAGSLSVTDEVRFSAPKTFETALVTFDSWRQVAPNKLLIGEGKQAVQVEIDGKWRKFRVESREVGEDLPNHRIPVRIGIAFDAPVEEGTIGVKITPQSP